MLGQVYAFAFYRVLRYIFQLFPHHWDPEDHFGMGAFLPALIVQIKK